MTIVGSVASSKNLSSLLLGFFIKYKAFSYQTDGEKRSHMQHKVEYQRFFAHPNCCINTRCPLEDTGKFSQTLN